MRRELVANLQTALPSLSSDLVFADIAATLIERNVIVSQEYHVILTSSSDAGRCAILVDILSGKEDATYDLFVDILKENYQWLADEVMGCGSLGDVTDSVPINSNVIDNQNSINQWLEQTREQNDVAQPCSSRKRSISPSPAPAVSSKRVAVQHRDSDSQTVNTQDCKESSTPPAKLSEETKSPPKTTEESPKLAQALNDEMMKVLKKNHRASRDWTTLAHALGLSRFVDKIRVKVLVFGEDLDICLVHLLQEWAGERPKDANLKNLLHALRNEGFNDVADELVTKFVDVAN